MARWEPGPSPVEQQIDQFLVCSICLERFRSPKVLPCLHTFCERCPQISISGQRPTLSCPLAPQVHPSVLPHPHVCLSVCPAVPAPCLSPPHPGCLQSYIPAQSLTLSCPVCRRSSILPERGVSALQDNFFITHLMELLQRGRDSDPPPGPLPLGLGASLCPPLSLPTPPCAPHRLPQLSAAIGLVSEISRQLGERKAEVVAEIGATFEELEVALRQRRGVLLRDLEATCAAKQKVLQAQLETLRQGQESILSSVAFAEQALEQGSAPEVLLVRKQMGERLGHLATCRFPEQPRENPQLDYSAETEGLRRSLLNLGALVTTSAVAHETVATGEGLRQAAVGQAASLSVTTKDRDGQLVRSGGACLRFQATGADGSSAEAQVLDNRNGTYELLYTPRAEGELLLSILLYGQPIRGSPFRARALKACDLPPSPDDVKRRVKSPGGGPGGGGGTGGHVRQKAVRRPSSMYSSGKRKENPIEDELIFRVGSRGREKGEFTNLQGISTSSTGRIVVADSNNQCVQVFSSEGQFRLRFGVRGRSPGQLQRPTGVTVDTSGDIIVADYDNRWVSIFSAEGKFKSKLGAGRLMGPKGVAVDRNGHIIVVDNKACCVFIFQPNGKLVTRFGSRGTAERQFAGPHFVAVNNKNEIVVTDFHNHSVKVYSADGEFLFKFGSHGEGNGQFNAPTGVAIDSNGNIIVADWGNSRIQVFDSSGSFLSYINTAAEPLYGPQGLALAPDGHVLVADSGNHCFKAYRYLQ
ncbi:TRIM3 protein, partial [Galbula dea]|nr:TRIM3 protein [Galbula dea]